MPQRAFRRSSRRHNRLRSGLVWGNEGSDATHGVASIVVPTPSLTLRACMGQWGSDATTGVASIVPPTPSLTLRACMGQWGSDATTGVASIVPPTPSLTLRACLPVLPPIQAPGVSRGIAIWWLERDHSAGMSFGQAASSCERVGISSLVPGASVIRESSTRFHANNARYRRPSP